MENVQDQSAVQDPMMIDSAEQQEPEISAEELYETLTTEPAEEEQQEERPEEEPELTPQERQKAAVESDIRSLMNDGLTGDELNAIVRDKGVREDVQNGKSFRAAVMAYLRKQIGASAPARTEKRGIPTATRASTASTSDHSALEDMSDEEFARFSEKATRLAREGKRVTMR